MLQSTAQDGPQSTISLKDDHASSAAGVPHPSVLSACATLVTGRPEYQQLLVTQRYDAAYIRAQAVAVGLGLHIVQTHDTAHIFTAKRPASGEEVTVTIAPSGMGCLITFQGPRPMM